jgi:hypothetical protein
MAFILSFPYVINLMTYAVYTRRKLPAVYGRVSSGGKDLNEEGWKCTGRRAWAERGRVKSHWKRKSFKRYGKESIERKLPRVLTRMRKVHRIWRVAGVIKEGWRWWQGRRKLREWEWKEKPRIWGKKRIAGVRRIKGTTESVKEEENSWGYKSCWYEDERKSW